MAETHAKPNHDYHLVDPSPWPLIGSIFVFTTAVGGIMWMKGIAFGEAEHAIRPGSYVFGVGVIGLLYVLASWWRDVVKEAESGKFHTRVVQISLRYGMVLFIASEVMFFVAWFWAFFDASLFAGDKIEYARVAFTGGHWPPKGIEVLDPWHFPLLNTLILLTSGTTVTWAHHALLGGDRSGLKWGLILDDPPRHNFHQRAGLRICACAIRLQRLDLWLDLLHGHGLPWLPCHHRHDLPDRLPRAGICRPVHAETTSRFRIRILVLAFRRRRLALPVLVHLCLGFLGRRGRALRILEYFHIEGRPTAVPLCLPHFLSPALGTER